MYLDSAILSNPDLFLGLDVIQIRKIMAKQSYSRTEQLHQLPSSKLIKMLPYWTPNEPWCPLRNTGLTFPNRKDYFTFLFDNERKYRRAIIRAVKSWKREEQARKDAILSFNALPDICKEQFPKDIKRAVRDKVVRAKIYSLESQILNGVAPKPQGFGSQNAPQRYRSVRGF